MEWIGFLVAFLVAAGGWTFREFQFRRERRTKAAQDAIQIIKDQRTHLEEEISKTDDDDKKEELCKKLDEKNDELRGLLSVSLRRTLKDAGLPPEEALITDGLSQLQPEQVTILKEEMAEIENLPLSDSIHDLLVQASGYYYSEQYEDAKETYDRLLALNPDSLLALNNRGVVYIKLDKYNEALADFNHALELDPTYMSPMYNIACLYSLQGEVDNALAYLEKAISNDEKIQEDAKTDKDFDNIREDPGFKKLVGED